MKIGWSSRRMRPCWRWDRSLARRSSNLRWMTKKGWFGRYGFYESADFTPDVRTRMAQRFALVRSWMAHHQGMSLLAIANFLQGGMVQNWFHRDARVQATELLLQERPVRYVAASKKNARTPKNNRRPKANGRSAAKANRKAA